MKLGSRSEYLGVMREDLFENSDCPFCEPDTDYVIWSSEYFDIMYNKFPLILGKKHLLVVPKRHIGHSEELTQSEASEFPMINTFLKEYFTGASYFSFIRERGCKSIFHLHYHYIEGELLYDPLSDMLEKQGYTINM